MGSNQTMTPDFTKTNNTIIFFQSLTTQRELLGLGLNWSRLLSSIKVFPVSAKIFFQL
jgi:hypothetical protein